MCHSRLDCRKDSRRLAYTQGNMLCLLFSYKIGSSPLGFLRLYSWVLMEKKGYFYSENPTMGRNVTCNIEALTRPQRHLTGATWLEITSAEEFEIWAPLRDETFFKLPQRTSGLLVTGFVGQAEKETRNNERFKTNRIYPKKPGVIAVFPRASRPLASNRIRCSSMQPWSLIVQPFDVCTEIQLSNYHTDRTTLHDKYRAVLVKSVLLKWHALMYRSFADEFFGSGSWIFVLFARF